MMAATADKPIWQRAIEVCRLLQRVERADLHTE